MTDTSGHDYAKAVEETAKAAGKGIEAAEKLGGWFGQLIQGPAKEAVGILQDQLRFTRWRRQLRLMDRQVELMKERGLNAPTRPVPINIALEIVRAGSLEDNDELQDLWAKLLVNAADANFQAEIRHAYLTILKDLTSLDVTCLSKIYSIDNHETQSMGVWTGALPETVSSQPQPGVEMRSDVALSLGNLLRLSLISSAALWGGGLSLYDVYHTELGRRFVEACTSRRARA